MLWHLFTGLGWPETALIIDRIAVGLFFFLSGYHKLFNAQRHAELVLTLRSDGLRRVNILQWLLAAAEFSGGLALAVGFLSVLAAIGLLIISVGATFTDGIKRIPGWRPLDRADYLDDVLYLPEVLYALLLLFVILAGPGPYSVDAVIAGYFQRDGVAVTCIAGPRDSQKVEAC
jgi:uncharacterized membrane protein YphA (DoxX/SURF4 family)